jgi:hypothetical protein
LTKQEKYYSRKPWILEDETGEYQYQGQTEGSDCDCYVLFVNDAARGVPGQDGGRIQRRGGRGLAADVVMGMPRIGAKDYTRCLEIFEGMVDSG